MNQFLTLEQWRVENPNKPINDYYSTYGAMENTGISNNNKPILDQTFKSQSQNQSELKSNQIINIIKFAVVFAIIGIIVGYFIYGKYPITGKFIRIEILFGLKSFNSYDNFFIDMFSNVIIEAIRQKVLISGVVGSIIGIIVAVLKK